MKRLKASTKFQVVVLVVIFVVVALAGLSAARITGITAEEAQNQGATLSDGATCHTPAPSDTVRPILLGIPGNYTAMDAPGEEYAPREFNLTVTFEGGPADSASAGFNLRVSAGTLVAGEGQEDAVRIESEGLEATHQVGGITQQEWNLVWTTPETAGEAVVFHLIVNVIDGPETREITGTGAPTSQWNVASFSSWGANGPVVPGVAAHVRVEDFGVGWLAYWVGIVSFVFLGIVMVAYYVVFRYGETSKATDHRARKGKSK